MKSVPSITLPSKPIMLVRAQVASWISIQERNGWPNAEIERAAGFVKCGLWACAHNNPIPHVIIEGLAKDVAALASACGFRQ